MDSLSNLFFSSKFEPEGSPVDESFVTLLDGRGALANVAVLDKRWPLLSLKSVYLKYPNNSNPERLDLWRAAALAYHDDLFNLVVQTSYDRFWCHILYEPRKILAFLRSFTSRAGRNYDLLEMNKDDAELERRISLLIFMAFSTIASGHRSPTEHIGQKKHSEMVQKFVKIPYLMDMCALYGDQPILRPMLQAGIESCFQMHRRLFTQLRIALRDISESLFQPLEERLSEYDPESAVKAASELSIKDLIDVVGYMCDILSTLHRLILCTADDIQIVFREAKFTARLAQFADKAVWPINREVTMRLQAAEGPERDYISHLERATQQGNIMEAALVDSFRRLECPAFYRDQPSGPDLAAALSVLLETLPHHQLFTIVHEKWAPIRRDVELAKKLQSAVEESIVDFLAHSIKEAYHSQDLTWEYATSGWDEPTTDTTNSKKAVAVPANAPPAKQKEAPQKETNQQSNKKVSPEGDQITGQILEMLDGMGLERKYVEACVVHYKCNLNDTVDAILSGSVPIEISNTTTESSTIPDLVAVEKPVPVVPAPVRPSIPLDQARPKSKAVAHTAPGTVIEKIYYGKRDLYEETEEETISDETRLVTIARVQQMYDDEYDDTNDEFEAEGAGLRLDDGVDSVARDLKAMAEEDTHKKGMSSEGPRNRAVNPIAQSSSHPIQDTRKQGGRPNPPFQTSFHGPASPSGPENARNPGRMASQDLRNRSHQEPYEEQWDDTAPAPRSNDPWVRQMQDNYNAQMARRPPPPAGDRSGDATKNRANKEKNKAHAANHNRKDRGSWKRNQGMF